MKKIGMYFSLLVMITIITGCAMMSSNVNLVSNLTVTFSGSDGKGVAQINTNNIKIGNISDDELSAFTETFEYAFSKYEKLSNGENIQIIVNYDEEMAKKLNLKVVQNERSYKVSGLSEKVATEEYKGYEIPKEWNLSEYEKEQYINSLRSSENQVAIDSVGEQAIENWLIGESKEETKYANKNFYFEDFPSPEDAYDDAYRYGKQSSQQFKVISIWESEKAVGYQCLFKETNANIVKGNDIELFFMEYWPVVIILAVLITIGIFGLYFRGKQKYINKI